MNTKMDKGLFQPRSQGLSSFRPLERERETLVGAGHVSLSLAPGGGKKIDPANEVGFV